MIQNTWLIILFLLSVEGLILYLDNNPKTKFLFKVLPAIFWIFFIPTLSSTLGLLDAKHEFYSIAIQNLLPMSLILLLIPVDIKAILKLGKPALIMMATGTVGVMIGTPMMFFLFQKWLSPDLWSGFGALSASWMGGSSNMIAVKEALGTPNEIFVPMVIVDTLVVYSWMGLLIALSAFQKQFDQWNQSDRKILEDLAERIAEQRKTFSYSWNPLTMIGLVLCSFLAFKAVAWAAHFLPEINNVFSTFAWILISVSFLGILLSLTPIRKVERFGSTHIGNFFLYFVLTCIGAQASLSELQDSMILIGIGFIIVLFHASLLIIVGRIIRAPMFLIATASQANLGGVVSGPLIANVYQPGFAAVGLLLAILGNIFGTYLGVLVGQLCRMITL